MPEDPDELRNAELHRRVAAQIRSDPSILDAARAKVERAIAREGGTPLEARLEWRAALRLLDAESLAEFLESDSPRMRRMQCSSPFFGLVR